MKTTGTILMLAAATGILLAASCSKMDNDKPQDVTAEQTSDLTQQLDEATKCLDEACAKLDLSELGPLAEKLKDGPLKDLITALSKGFNPENIHLGPSSISEVYQYLKDLLAISQRSFTVIVGENSYHISCTTNLVDGVVSHTLLIQKNQEQLLKMVSFRSLSGYNGTLAIRDMELILDHNHKDFSEQSISLTLKRAGEEKTLLVLRSDITDAFTPEDIQNKHFGRSSNYSASVMDDAIVVNGHVKHVGKFFAQMAPLAYIYKEGTEEDICKEVAASFAENVSIYLHINGAAVGVIYLDPIYSLELEKFTVALMVNSPMLGEEPLDITTALAAFGFDIKDIFGPKG